jgi:hypothetical protein
MAEVVALPMRGWKGMTQAQIDAFRHRGPQQLTLASDRRNVVDLVRAKIDREYLRAAKERRLTEMAKRRLLRASGHRASDRTQNGRFSARIEPPGERACSGADESGE